MANPGLRSASAVLLASAILLGGSGSRSAAPPGLGATPEMRDAAAEMVAERRANARRQNRGEPAVWMFAPR